MTERSLAGVTDVHDHGKGLPWDESTRPHGPAPQPREYTDGEQAAGQHLIDVHDHLRSELAQIRDVVDQVAGGQLPASYVLERVDRALVALVTDPLQTAEVRAAVDLLTDTLLSHLSYEERELVEPLARLGFY